MRQLSEERSLSVNLRALVVEMDSLSAPERVESAAAVFNETTRAASAIQALEYSCLAAAAGLLLAFAIAWRMELARSARSETSDVVASVPFADTTSTRC